MLEFLHNCSQQLLDANIESTELSNSTANDTKDFENGLPELESIEDLIRFPKITSKDLNSQQIIVNQLDYKPLSPSSTVSDSGYESANSPQNSFDNQIEEQLEDFHWKQTLSELFPDLI